MCLTLIPSSRAWSIISWLAGDCWSCSSKERARTLQGQLSPPAIAAPDFVVDFASPTWNAESSQPLESQPAWLAAAGSHSGVVQLTALDPEPQQFVDLNALQPGGLPVFGAVMSVSVWARFMSLDTESHKRVFEFRGQNPITDQFTFNRAVSLDTMRVDLYNSPGDESLFEVPAAEFTLSSSLAKWTNWIITIDAGLCSIYLNSRLVAQRSNGIVIRSARRPIAMLGASSYLGDGRSIAQFDSFAMWAGTALQQQAVQRLFAQQMQLPQQAVMMRSSLRAKQFELRLQFASSDQEPYNTLQLTRLTAQPQLNGSQALALQFNHSAALLLASSVARQQGGLTVATPSPYNSTTQPVDMHFALSSWNSLCAASVASPEVEFVEEQTVAETCVWTAAFGSQEAARSNVSGPVFELNFTSVDQVSTTTSQQSISSLPQWSAQNGSHSGVAVFDGVQKSVDVSLLKSQLIVPQLAPQISVCAWAKFTAFAFSSRLFDTCARNSTSGACESQVQFGLYQTQPQLQMTTRDPVSGIRTLRQILNPQLQLNQWTHACARFNSAQWSIHLNGARTQFIATGGAMIQQVQRSEMKIGSSSTAGESLFAGLIDSIHLWNSALADVAILRVFTSHLVRPLVQLQLSASKQLSVVQLSLPLQSAEPLNTFQSVTLQSSNGTLIAQLNMSTRAGGSVFNISLPPALALNSSQSLTLSATSTLCTASVFEPLVFEQVQVVNCSLQGAGVSGYCSHIKYCSMSRFNSTPSCFCPLPAPVTGARCELQRSCSTLQCRNGGTCLSGFPSLRYADPLQSNAQQPFAVCRCRCAWRGVDCSLSMNRRCCADQAGQCASAGSDAQFNPVFNCWTEFGNCSGTEPRPHTVTIQSCDQFGQMQIVDFCPP